MKSGGFGISEGFQSNAYAKFSLLSILMVTSVYC